LNEHAKEMETLAKMSASHGTLWQPVQDRLGGRVCDNFLLSSVCPS
jgi:hypothetical protein